jgi:hypothetical protein
MIATAPFFGYSDLLHSGEPGLPYFLDGIDVDPDDLGDWWLDLGAVDLSVSGV